MSPDDVAAWSSTGWLCSRSAAMGLRRQSSASGRRPPARGRPAPAWLRRCRRGGALHSRCAAYTSRGVPAARVRRWEALSTHHIQRTDRSVTASPWPAAWQAPGMGGGSGCVDLAQGVGPHSSCSTRMPNEGGRLLARQLLEARQELGLGGGDRCRV